jgi:hypothetical protein
MTGRGRRRRAIVTRGIPGDRLRNLGDAGTVAPKRGDQATYQTASQEVTPTSPGPPVHRFRQLRSMRAAVPLIVVG